jgi:Spy/CpxP family protein refolding chaperone
MSKIFLRTAVLSAGLALSFALSGPASAGQGKGEFSVDKKLQHMTEKLSLTPEQQSSVRAVLEEKKAKMDAGEKADWGSYKDRIRAVLTDEQKSAYDAMGHKDRKGHKKAK